MQRTQIKSKYCKNCVKRTKHERYITTMGFGDLVMTLLTAGVWFVGRMLLKPKFRCAECGK